MKKKPSHRAGRGKRGRQDSSAEHESPLIFDAVALDQAPSAAAPSISELLEFGTTDEVREVIGWFGTRLRFHNSAHPFPPIPDSIWHWFGERLEEIGAGKDPRKAFGLNRKVKQSVRHRKVLHYLVDSLIEQAPGMPRAEAEAMVGSYDHERKGFTGDPDGGAGERVRKSIAALSRRKKSRKK